MKFIIRIVLAVFVCVATCSCHTTKTAQRTASSTDVRQSRVHEETLRASSWAELLTCLHLDSITVSFLSEDSIFKPEGFRSDGNPAVPQSTLCADCGSAVLPLNRDAALAASPPKHPPRVVTLKAYGLHLSKSAMEKSVSQENISDSAEKSAVSEISADRGVAAPRYIHVSLIALGAIVMAAAAAIVFLRQRRIL